MRSSIAGGAAASGRTRIVDGGLTFLLADLDAAKSEFARAKGPECKGHSLQRARLLCCLEAFAAALTARNLPVPPRIRDDLYLLRALGTTL